jgi:hypothetical protein
MSEMGLHDPFGHLKHKSSIVNDIIEVSNSINVFEKLKL